MPGDENKGWGEPTTQQTFAKPLLVYDITTDSFRPATQKDLDQLSQVAQAYGKLVVEIVAQHNALGVLLNWPTRLDRVRK